MKAYEGKYFAFIGAIRWLLKPYANYEGKFNFKQKIMGIKAGLWSDLFKWLMFCRGQGLLRREVTPFPHCGLDPQSAANINIEEQGYRDYNKK